MSNPTVVVSWFSAGASSAVATKMMAGTLDHIIYIHIEDQHPDTLRFVADCERWFGRPVERLQSPYRTVAAACFAGSTTGYLNGPSGANCTRWLKKRVRKEWEAEHRFFNTFRYVWGFDVDEKDRANRLREEMPDDEHVFPLIDAGITKEAAHGILAHAGIARPAMYDLGYPNNNCVGCVKGGKGYWNMIRVHFPNVFAARSALERKIGHSCINGTFLDELDPEAGRTEGPIVPECGAMCELQPLEAPK